MQVLRGRALLGTGLIRCYITDRSALVLPCGSERTPLPCGRGSETVIEPRRSFELLLECIERNARAGVDLIQIREKDLAARDLLALTQRALARTPLPRGRGSESVTEPRVVVNDRVDVALAAGAHGAHLRSSPVPPSEWRRIVPDGFVLGVSCHTLEDIVAARGADYVCFGPVFGSPGKAPAVGLERLREAAASTDIPVLALGGVTEENAGACIAAGAAGIAAIRWFQEARAR